MFPVSRILSGKRTVIVEDEALTLMLMHRLLTRAGLIVVGQATRGEEAIEIILREKPDLVTMDLTLKGMSGLEVTRIVMEQFPTCVVIISAHHMDTYQQQSEAAGACGYIVKPFTAATVILDLEAYYEKNRRKVTDVAEGDR